MTNFYIGKIFTLDEYEQAFAWLEEQNNPYYCIKEIEVIGEVRQFQLVDKTPTTEEQTKTRQKDFEANFFEIPAIEGIFKGGWFRKQPKGYQSAVESINTCFNAVTVLGLLPADYLIFYTKPDFTDETQCSEEWLVANQFKNNTMTAQEFGQFYVAFMTGWNNQEHKTDILA